MEESPRDVYKNNMNPDITNIDADFTNADVSEVHSDQQDGILEGLNNIYEDNSYTNSARKNHDKKKKRTNKLPKVENLKSYDHFGNVIIDEYGLK